MDLRKVSFVLTSCRRFDLLEETLVSFKKTNTYPLHQMIVIEDSGDETVRDVVARAGFPDARVIVNNPQIGQMASIDKAYAEVTGEFIFHCEDDWEFYRPGYIEESIPLLDHDEKGVQVVFRDHSEVYDWALQGELQEVAGVKFREIAPDLHPTYFGYSFNPGLRRMKEYELIGKSFTKLGHEKEASLYFKKAGYHILTLEEGAVRHLGHRRTVRDPIHYRPITRPEKWLNSIKKRLRRFGLIA
ncbi:MAG: glycosyltransferase [Pseudomonadota bacterium]